MMKKFGILLFIILTALPFSSSVFAESEEITTIPPSAVSDAYENGIIIIGIALCLLFGFLLSFYIIHRMKNKH